MSLLREEFGNRRQLGKYSSLSTSRRKGETTTYSHCALTMLTDAAGFVQSMMHDTKLAPATYCEPGLTAITHF